MIEIMVRKEFNTDVCLQLYRMFDDLEYDCLDGYGNILSEAQWMLGDYFVVWNRFFFPRELRKATCEFQRLCRTLWNAYHPELKALEDKLD